MSKNLKKIILVGMALVFALSGSALAAWDVRTAISSEPVSGAKNSCEKYGAITFTFQENAVIRDGDLITIDLATGAFACHNQDFVLLADFAGLGVPAQVPTLTAVTGTLGAYTGVPGVGSSGVESGAWKINPIQTSLAWGLTSVGTGLYARVTTTKDSRRLMVRFYDADVTGAGATLGALTNYDRSSSIMVQPNTQLTLTIFNGEDHNAQALPASGGAAPYLALKDHNADGVYTLGLQLTNATLYENYLCGYQTDAFVGDLVNVSFDSRSEANGKPPEEDIFTFQGQRQIAHFLSGDQITLLSCTSGKKTVDLCGFVAAPSQTSCVYDYETATGYCPDRGASFFTGYPGNQMIIQTTGDTFGAASYYFEFEISGAAGTYFGGMPVVSKSWDKAGVTATPDACASPTQLIPPGLVVQSVTRADGTVQTTLPIAWPTGANCTAPAAASQIRKITTATFSLGSSKRFVLDFANFVYDKAVAVDGNKAEVIVRLMKSPCGLVFTGTRCVANYLTTCAAAGGKTTLLFPYTTPLTASVQGWWFGMAVCNPTDTAGDAVIKVYENDGLKGQTTVNVKARGTYVVAGETLLTLPGMPAGMGQSPAHIIVECNFSQAGGFGMMGNGIDSTGYTAYGDTGWGF